MAIHLRPITLEDGEQIVRWRNNENVKAHCMKKHVITKESNEVFYHTNVETGKYKQFIVEHTDDDFPIVCYPIATVYLKDIDNENKHCELCIFTSSDREWVQKSQSEGVRQLLEKAFNEYDMHKVYSYVFFKFPDEVELLKAAGFTVEAILKDESMNNDGEYEDIVRLVIFKSEF